MKPMLARTACPLWVDAVEKVRGIETGQQYPRVHPEKMLTVRPTCDENLQTS
jgi:hypothetical protein